MSNKVTSVTFRMYNTGSVGDCLLLLFNKKTGPPFKMLIDCGGWNAPSPDITACVNDIFSTTGGELDLLVVTHQHEDHISGFNQARAVFDNMTVKQVWMSWIEDATDPIAIILKEKYGKKVKQIRKLADLAKKKLGEKARQKSTVVGLNKRMGLRKAAIDHTLELLDFEEGINRKSRLAAGKRTNDDAMEFVRKKGESIEYRLPGQVIQIPEAGGIKFHILGPPRDADMKFFKIREDEGEMYHLAAARNAKAIIQTASIVKSGIILEDLVSPFATIYNAKGEKQKEIGKAYASKDMKWRQIETDWLESAASIAMRATNLTNNTSLAMALEFEDSGKVILLPADGQSGNWMGWHKPEVSKELKANGGKSATELLKNTIFYKVGHHGSPNGTASKSGLELMSAKELVVMMPLVQAKVPAGWGGPSHFPGKALYNELIAKSKGRVIRTDEGIATHPDAKKLRNALPKAEKQRFTKAFMGDARYQQFEISG